MSDYDADVALRALLALTDTSNPEDLSAAMRLAMIQDIFTTFDVAMSAGAALPTSWQTFRSEPV